MAHFDSIIPIVTNEQQLTDFIHKHKVSFPPETKISLCGSSTNESPQYCIRCYPICIALGLKFPLHPFIRRFFWHYNLELTQLSPTGYIILLGFLALRRISSSLHLGFNEFRELYIVKQSKDLDIFNIIPRDPDKVLIADVPTPTTISDQGWDCDVLELKLNYQHLYLRTTAPFDDYAVNVAPMAGTFDRAMINKALQLKERSWFLLLEVTRNSEPEASAISQNQLKDAFGGEESLMLNEVKGLREELEETKMRLEETEEELDRAVKKAKLEKEKRKSVETKKYYEGLLKDTQNFFQMGLCESEIEILVMENKRLVTELEAMKKKKATNVKRKARH